MLSKDYIKKNLFRADGKFNGKKAKSLGIDPAEARNVWLDNPIEGSCSYCGNPTKFINFAEGYSEFCSRSCVAKGTQAKKKATNLIKYGVDNPRKNEAVKEKARKTNQERYGGPAPASSAEVKEKMRKTNEARYGGSAPAVSADVRAKMQATSVDNNGTANPMHNPEIVDKLKRTQATLDKKAILEKREATNLANTGYRTNLLDPAFRERCVAISIERHGTEYFSQSEEVKTKVREHFKKKFGVINPSFRHLHDETIDLLTNTDELLKLVNASTVPAVADKLGVNPTTIYNRLNDAGVKWDAPSGYSTAEVQIQNLLDEIGVRYFPNDRTLIKPKEVDVYIPEHNLAIEYHGIYWHAERQLAKSMEPDEAKRYHLMKHDKCSDKGVQLFQIFENEWTEPKTRAIWESKIRLRLGQIKNKYFARKCTIDDIDSNTFDNFCDEHHLQGVKYCGIRKGLFYKGELLAVAGWKRRDSTTVELERLSFKKDTVVIGGASKLLSKVKEKTVSFADKRISDATVYNKTGFTVAGHQPPSYKYLIGDKLYNKQKFRHKKLKAILPDYDPSLTEYQNMAAHGYDRVWNAGLIKLVRPALN